MLKKPRLRSVDKRKPPYPANSFPKGFPVKLAGEIVYLLATRGTPRLEGSDWEEVFAKIIGAEWKPSNIGLDDIVSGSIAWGAKTVKNPNPFKAKRVRLISGRNSPVYSFGDGRVSDCNPDELGEKVLEIWNARVQNIRSSYKHVRTVVLIKSSDLLKLSVFEFETTPYSSKQFRWEWNARGNLEGFDKDGGDHAFTWQPHGSQFTIIEPVPPKRLSVRIKKPPLLDFNSVLKVVEFDDSWVEIVPHG